jgi:hypothetical protein
LVWATESKKYFLYLKQKTETMKKFLVTYHAPAVAMRRPEDITPEQHEAGMKLWMDWFAKCEGHVIDMGAPLKNSQSQSVDGSFTPGQKQFSGYTIIQAENMDEAKSLMQGHPHTSGWSQAATLEVHEVAPMPGM